MAKAAVAKLWSLPAFNGRRYSSGSPGGGEWPAEIPFPGNWYSTDVGTIIPITSGGTSRTFSGTGTAESPIIYMGDGTQTFTGEVTVAGAYVQVRGINVYGAPVSMEGEHLCLRHSEVQHYNPGRNASAISAVGSNLVCWANHIHDNGNMLLEENDLHGFNAGNGSSQIWYFDNHSHHNAGDSIQVGHGALNSISGVYCFWNLCHEDGENAFDVKEVTNFLIVENVGWGYRARGVTSEGAVVASHYCPIGNRILRNEFYLSDVGVSLSSLHSTCTTRPLPIEIFGNNFHDIAGNGVQSWMAGATVLADDNTFTDIGTTDGNAIDLFNTEGRLLRNIVTRGGTIVVGPSAYNDPGNPLYVTRSGNIIDGTPWN